MANYSKSSGFARFWAVFMTILLAASIFFGIVTEGFKNWDASTWFKKDAEKGTVIDGDGNEMNGDTVYNMPSNMVFRPALRGATPGDERDDQSDHRAVGRYKPTRGLDDRLCGSVCGMGERQNAIGLCDDHGHERTDHDGHV